MVTLAFAVFLVVHALIHVMGFVKAFGLAELPDLTLPISHVQGVLWLVAASLFLVTAVALYLNPRVWWVVGAVALAVSMLVIVPSWRDARVGALANLVALIGVVFGALTYGPTSLHAAYERDVRTVLAATGPDPRLVADTDLSSLPMPVQRYLRATGAFGQPRVRRMFARMHGRIRGAPDAPWMPFTAEQYDTFGERPSRLFYMTATRAMVPVQGYHRFMAPPASMRIKAAALVPVVDVSGEEMTQSETVTLFNDLVLMAPAALIDAPVTYEPAPPRRAGGVAREVVRARFTHLGRTVSADLVFGADGMLVDFVSDDRYASSPDGASMTRQRWSTPVRNPQAFGSVRLVSTGEGRWHDGDRSWAYLELTIDEVRYDIGS